MTATKLFTPPNFLRPHAHHHSQRKLKLNIFLVWKWLAKIKQELKYCYNLTSLLLFIFQLCLYTDVVSILIEEDKCCILHGEATSSGIQKTLNCWNKILGFLFDPKQEILIILLFAKDFCLPPIDRLDQKNSK